MRENKQQIINQEYRFQLECILCNCSRSLMKERLKKEGIPISSESLDSVGENYSEELIKTLETCMLNLIETDITIIKDMLKKNRIRVEKKEGHHHWTSSLM